MDRFDTFTDRARKVLTLAQDEAARRNHNYIGTEHLLLGLLREGEGVAARVLEGMNVELAKVRTAVEFIIGRGDRPVVGDVGLTPAAKRVIELAIVEARRLEHRYIGTEHLLLGLLREREGIAAGVLSSMWVDLDNARAEVLRVLGDASVRESTAGNVAPMVVSGAVPLDEARRTLEISRRYVEVGQSPLLRVVGIGLAATDAGVTVELIALEIRGAGAILYWKARLDEQRMLGEPAFTLSDDAGTDYAIFPAGRSGTDREMKGEVLVVPVPPGHATTIAADLSGFAARRFPPGMSTDELRGAWHFEFPVTPWGRQ